MPRVTPSYRRFRRRLLAVSLLSLALVSCWKVEPDLVVSTTVLDFAAVTEFRSFTVRNDSEDNSLTSGVTTLDYQIKADKPWVTVTPKSGACGGMEKIAHNVTVDRSQMLYGTNAAILSVTSNGGSATILVQAIRPVPGCSNAPTAPTSPSPAYGAQQVATDVTLSWDDGDSQCSQLTATYDVYFGNTTPPPFHHSNDSLKVWQPPAPLANNTIYYWRVVAKDANGSTSAREWYFRTVCILPPTPVALISPADNATGVYVQAKLSWTGGNSQCGGMTPTYDVYFGSTSPPPFLNNTSLKGWDPGLLAKNTTYYWKVVAKDANGSVSSPEQSFTTQQAVCATKPSVPTLVTPSNNATVPVDEDLVWSGGDSQCAGLTATYDVYFGTTNPPPLHHNNGTSKTWDAVLEYSTVYYWYVVAKDTNGSTGSSVRMFRTPCNLPPTTPTPISPANNATGVTVTDNLVWNNGNSQCTGQTATFDVYFGITSPPPFVGSSSIKGWEPGVMLPATKYYWKIVAKDGFGSASSVESSFTTGVVPCTSGPGAVSLQSPVDGATGVALDANLTWTGGNSQCAGSTATYDVYFGTTSPPPLDHNNGAAKTWDPGALTGSTHYYWRIVAKDSNGSASSVERDFTTTAPPCTALPSAPSLSSPGDGATGVALTANLSWTGGNSQCAGLTATYDVYFGTTSPPPFDHNNGSTKTWDPGTLAGSTTYYWRIVATDANGSTTSVERDFTTVAPPCTAAPSAPTLSSPADGATGVALTANLSWTGGNSQCAGLTATYDIYFGTTSPPPLDHNNGSTKTWDPGTLTGSTHYYWRIVAKDANGSNSSAERDFITTAPPCVDAPAAPTPTSPANGATDVALNANLSWTGGNSQCAGLTATYDVYFGTTNPPSLDHNNGSTKTWDPGALSGGTTYYWKIVAKDDNGSTSGPVSSFTTLAACVLPPTAPTVTEPVNNATDIALNENINWAGGNSQCAGLTATYDVYFGTNDPPPFAGNSGTSKGYDPGAMQYSTTYYWRIVAKDANGETQGPVWHFTTEEPCLSLPTAPCTPSPTNNRTNVNENADLAWGCGDSQCGLPVTYDVYFGTTADLGEAQKRGSTTEKLLTLPKQSRNTKYYWKVVARDANGSTSSPVWSYTTRD